MAKSKPQAKSVATGGNGKTLADFRSIHDKTYTIPLKIREGLESLGKEGWEYEAEFIKRCGVSSMDFGRFREDFADFYVTVSDGARMSKRRVWAGTKATASKMREMV